MQHKRLIFSAVLVFGFGLTGLLAQQAILATSGNVIVSGQGTVSWSVGQIVYTTNNGTTGSVAQGVQQSFEISVVNGIEKTKNLNILVSAYPNPATDYLLLRIENSEITNISFQLFDIGGKLLEGRELSGSETIIDFSNLVPAIYYLRVNENNNELKTFRIIKKL